MSTRKAVAVLPVVLGILFVAPPAVASDHENQSGGFRYGSQGQVFGSPPHDAGRAYAAQSKPKRPRASAAARAAYGSVSDSRSALDALAVQHKDPAWDHRYQSWCDVDPNCNGWNQKMQEYERSQK